MFLGLDLGTTNIKAVLTDAAGGVLARGAAPVPLHQVGPIGVEQDIEEIWAATLAALRQIGASADLSAVQAVGVSSQGGAIQILDGDGRCLGNVVSWLDGRGKPFAEEFTARLGRDWFAGRIGHGGCGWVAGQLLRLRSETPGLMAAPNRIAFVGDIIVGRLCGCATHDPTSLGIVMMYNPWTGRTDADVLRELGIAETQLPALKTAREPAGRLSAEAARATGLPGGIPVSPAVHDQYAASLGSAATSAGDVMLGAGTAWVLLAATDKLMRPVIDEAFVCRHPAAGLYGQMLSVVNGGSAVSWAKRTLSLDAQSGDLDSIMSRSPAGSDGLRFRPLLVPGGGARLDSSARGRLSGLQLSHGPSHIMRAVVEGLAMELNRYLGFLGDAGLRIGRLVMCGGAAGSEVTPQIVADVTGLGVACCAETETSAKGAVVIARGLVEPNADLAGLSRAMIRPMREFSPGPDTAAYQSMFRQYVESLAEGR